MDAVATVRQQFEQVFGEWCGEAPLVLADGKAFSDWAGQGPTLYDTAEALGIDPSKVIRTLSGDTLPSTMSRPTMARRASRTRARSTTRSNGGGLTGEQLLTALRKDGPMNQSQLAARFNTTRQTIAKRLDELVGAGKAERQGEGSRLTWMAREPIAA